MQIKWIKEFSKQIERAIEDNKQCIILGDANLCYKKWKDEDFIHKSIAVHLLNALEQGGFDVMPVKSGTNAQKNLRKV